MAAVSPRVQVSLSLPLDALVGRMARLQRMSKSQVIRELLESAEPALSRAAALMEAAEGAPQQLLDHLGGSLLRAQERAEDQLAGMLSRLDLATGDLVSQAQKITGKRPPVGRRPPARLGQARAVPPASNPPASNRGVKSTKSGTRRALKGARK